MLRFKIAIRNQALKSEKGPAHKEERPGPQENKEWRSLAHGEKRIKYWALGRKKRHKESMGHGLKQEVVRKKAQKGGS